MIENIDATGKNLVAALNNPKCNSISLTSTKLASSEMISYINENTNFSLDTVLVNSDGKFETKFVRKGKNEN